MQFWELSPVLRLAVASRLRTLQARAHLHPFYEIGLVLEGRCAWHFGRGPRANAPTGTLIIVPPGTTHWEESDAPARIAWAGFDLAPGASGQALHAAALRAWPCGPWLRPLAGLLDIVAREHSSDDSGAALRARLALWEALILLGRITASPGRAAAAPAPGAAIARSAAHYLAHNLSKPLRVAELARYYGISPGHLGALFRRTFGAPPRSHLLRARLAKARELLRSTRLSIKEIAAACGFSHAPHFCRRFRAATGASPGHWRRNAARAA